MDSNENEKYCSSCDSWLPLTEFHRDRTHRDGYKSNCKSCRSGKPVEPPQESPSRAELQGKTKEELETIARSRAIRRLVENHQSEFAGLVSRYRLEVGIRRTWVEVT